MEKDKILIFLRNILLVVTAVFLFLGLANLSKKPRVLVSTESVATTTQKVVAAEDVVASSTPKKEVVKKEILPCQVGNTDFDCYREYYIDLVVKKGVPEAFKVLKSDYSKNPYIVAQCHPITHVIGHAALELYPTVTEAFNHGDPYCWSGYYHGVMEEISERIGVKGIEKQLNNICSQIKGKENYSFDYYNCVHGLGHGVMAVNNDELFVSLKMCDNLTGSWEKESCYGGVYMENVIIDNSGLVSKYLKPEDPMYPCNAVDTKYKSSCYLMQSSYALKVRGYDFNKVFADCRGADEGFRNICYQSIGRDASGQSSSNAAQTKAKCDLGQTYDEKSNCVIGAVKDFVSYFHSDVQAKSFCSSLSADLVQVCTDTAVSYYRSF
jgi:hypothetical protein